MLRTYIPCKCKWHNENYMCKCIRPIYIMCKCIYKAHLHIMYSSFCKNLSWKRWSTNLGMKTLCKHWGWATCTQDIPHQYLNLSHILCIRVCACIVYGWIKGKHFHSVALVVKASICGALRILDLLGGGKGLITMTHRKKIIELWGAPMLECTHN